MKFLAWTGHHQLFAVQPQATCLALPQATCLPFKVAAILKAIKDDGVFVVMVVGGLLLAGSLMQSVATDFSRLPQEVWRACLQPCLRGAALDVRGGLSHRSGPLRWSA